MARIRIAYHAVLASFWFLPSLITLALAALSVWALRIDAAADALLSDLKAEGARAVLTAIAGGMMTVASLVFSLTFVALTSMSAQFGPRILLFFMNDRSTQIVLGVFVGAFLFALLALLHVEDGAPPPAPAVIGAILLAVAAFGVMIYFVHHIARSLQADVLVARLGRQLKSAIRNLEARRDASEIAKAAHAFGEAAEGVVLPAPTSGYVQLIDAAALARIAAAADLRLELLFKPADFLIEGAPMIRAFGDRAEDLSAGDLASGVVLGPQRTPEQEAHFEISALAEVAIRALSPGINDPYTAIACVHQLVDGLALISRLGVSGDLLHRAEDVPRVRERRRDFAEFLDAAFSAIRAHARGDALVARHILDGYRQLAEAIAAPADLAALEEARAGLAAELETSLASERDRRDLLALADQVAETIAGKTARAPVSAADRPPRSASPP